MSESLSPATKGAGSFASLLESLTSPAKKTNGTWDDSDLLDDVATISYEQALRSHRRVPPASPLPPDESRSPATPTSPRTPLATNGRKRKTASITIRITDAEEAQLHERAAAAQLSVSAYLRSCIFEAEELRAKVKEALARMQAPPQTADQADKPTRNWRERFLSGWSHRSRLKTEN